MRNVLPFVRNILPSVRNITTRCVVTSRHVQSIRELQNSVRDGIILYRALLDEVRHNMEAEKTAVSTFCRQLHETVSQLQARLLADVEGYDGERVQGMEEREKEGEVERVRRERIEHRERETEG